MIGEPFAGGDVLGLRRNEPGEGDGVSHAPPVVGGAERCSCQRPPHRPWSWSNAAPIRPPVGRSVISARGTPASQNPGAGRVECALGDVERRVDGAVPGVVEQPNRIAVLDAVDRAQRARGPEGHPGLSRSLSMFSSLSSFPRAVDPTAASPNLSTRARPSRSAAMYSANDLRILLTLGSATAMQ